VRGGTDRLTNWQSGSMALRWAAASFVDTEKSYRHIMGHAQRWMLKATLDESLDQEQLALNREAT
jgi:hypothetical protein